MLLFIVYTLVLYLDTHTVHCRESIIIEGQLMNMATRQLSIVAPSKKHVKGKLKKDVQVSETNSRETVYLVPYTHTLDETFT